MLVEAGEEVGEMPRLRLGFNDFGWDALTETAQRHGLGVGEFVSASCRRHLARERTGMPPVFMRSRYAGTPREITVDLGAAEMRALENEAEESTVPLDAIIRHAVLALIADIDSGRLSAELAANLDEDRADR